MAGDLGATVKLKRPRPTILSMVGLRLCIQSITYPNPKYRVAIKPVNRSDDEKLSEIPTVFRKKTKQSGLSTQRNLSRLLFRVRVVPQYYEVAYRNNDKLPITFYEPRIPYRETITKQARADYLTKAVWWCRTIW